MSCPEVIIMIGVFFDGTGNNATNAMTDPTGEGSAANASSNVAKLSELYYGPDNDTRHSCGGYNQRFSSIYVDGIGTVANAPDVDEGMRWGTGDTGVEQRVFDTALDVGARINRLKGAGEPKQIILDVFGFSRGAAAARYFTNGFNAGSLTIDRWGPFNDSASVPEGRKIDIGVLGIFDTVAAIGLPANTRNGDVNVHLKTSSAMDIFHLTAADEFRNSFCLNENEQGGGTSIEIPGAHSDVGGGDPHGFDESPKIEKPFSGIASPQNLANAQASAQASVQRTRTALATRYVAEGWIEASDLPGALDIRFTNMAPFTIPYPGPVPMGYQQTTIRFDAHIHLVRPWVTGHLAHVALHKMHKEAKLKRVPFLDIPQDEAGYEIHPDLASIAPKIINGGSLSNAEERLVRRGFTHHSSHYNKASYWIIYPMEPAPGRTRIKFRNIASRAS